MRVYRSHLSFFIQTFLFLQRVTKTPGTLERAHKTCDKLSADIVHKWLKVPIILGCTEDAIKIAQIWVAHHRSFKLFHFFKEPKKHKQLRSFLHCKDFPYMVDKFYYSCPACIEDTTKIAQIGVTQLSSFKFQFLYLNSTENENIR